MNKVKDVKNSIELLKEYPKCWSWQDFGDKGNACSGPFILETEVDILEDAIRLAAVKIAMPKGTTLHQDLANSVATLLGNQWVTYDWLIKAVTRIISFSSSYEEFMELVNLSLAVQTGMGEK